MDYSEETSNESDNEKEYDEEIEKEVTETEELGNGDKNEIYSKYNKEDVNDSKETFTIMEEKENKEEKDRNKELDIILINKNTKIKVKAVCDTGATMTVINEDVAETLGLDLKSGTEINLPYGSKINAQKTNLEVYDTQREKKTKIEATVMKNVKHEIFLGEKDLIKMKIIDKEYKKKPKISKYSKIDLNNYLTIYQY